MVKLSCPRSTSRWPCHSLGFELRPRNWHSTLSTAIPRTHISKKSKVSEKLLFQRCLFFVFIVVAFYPAAALLVLSSYAGCEQVTLSVACMVLATAFITLNQVGLICSQVGTFCVIVWL